MLRQWHRILVAVAAVVLSMSAVIAAAPGASAGTRPAGGTGATRPDFNNDGYADLAVGVPYEDLGSATSAGGVNVIYGSAAGLASANNQFWSQNSPGIIGVAGSGDLFGWSLATADFNHDGYSDLAIGVRAESSAVDRSGGVNVIYGSAAGLNAAGNQFWSQDSPDILDSAEQGDQFGYSLVAADFNQDGFGDLAVGNAFENLAGTDEGAANVVYGSADGLTATGNQFWTQDSPGMFGQVESNDRFAWSMASGDFNGDGYGDLAIGVPYESDGINRMGRVQLLYGSASGLTTSGTQVWDQNSPGILDQAELRDQFGQSLAAGDFNGDGYGDLAVGVWFEDFTYIGNQGALNVIYGSAAGLTATGNQFWSQDSPGILDRAEQGDQFSQTLAPSDYNGDGYADLAVGVPWEDFIANVNQDQGGINVIYGSAAGLTATGNQLWSQNSPGILDTAERDDHFSESLGGADVNGDGSDDLAIGTPWEDLAATNAGAVNVIYGSQTRLASAGNELWSQNSPGIVGDEEPYDRFGWSISSERQRAGTPRLCYRNVGGPC